MQIHKEIDDSGEEVLSRVGKESLRATFLLTASLVERGKQCRAGLRSSREVWNILALDRINPIGILYIREVYDTETAIIR